VANYLDEAFNWLVVLLGAVAAAMSQFPERVPFLLQGSLAVVRIFVFPFVILVILWLAGSLARETGSRVVLKALSWIYASAILAIDFVALLFGSVPIVQEMSRIVMPVYQFFVLTPGLAILFPLIFYIFLVRPRMRELYKDSRIFHSFSKQALLYIVAIALLLLALGVVEQVFGVMPMSTLQ